MRCRVARPDESGHYEPSVDGIVGFGDNGSRVGERDESGTASLGVAVKPRGVMMGTLDRLSAAAAMNPSEASSTLACRDPLDLRYPGGKGVAGLAEWIVGQFPAHIYYAEPFIGKGSVFRAKPPALRSWLVDSDPAVIEWWRQQSFSPGSIVAADDGIRNRQPRRCAIAESETQPRSSAVTMLQADGIRFVELAAEWQLPELLTYIDPPYMLATRTKRRLYANEMADADHQRLLAAVKQLRGPTFVSGYRSDLYLAELSDWRLETRWVITRGGTLREECLWSNVVSDPKSSALAMQYSALGSNFRERERIARKVARWSANFQAMPRHERRAILLELLDAERCS